MDRTESLVRSLRPQTRDSAAALINAARDAGYPVVIVEARRGRDRQAALYAQGRTAPGRVVTWTRTSKHLTGQAFDVAFSLDGKVTYDVPPNWWNALGRASPAFGLRWGGSFGDLGHFEAP